MEVGRAQPVSAACSRPPTYEQSCGFKQNSFCTSFFNDALKDPVLIFITIAVVIGSFCLLSGLFLLCLVSKTIQDETSEAILLLGIGVFISCIAGISWKLTNKRQMSQFIDSIGAESLQFNDREIT